MMLRSLCLLTLVCAVPAVAQNSAADVSGQPVTQSLNAGIAAEVAGDNAAEKARQDQYELDRAAFRAQVVARREKIMLDQAAYAQQQAAYADAMAAWRLQSDACKKGDRAACKARTPVPADFYVP